MKTDRQKIILSIIAEENIRTQGELLEALWSRNVSATQATLSRDIRDLNLVKENGCYTAPPAMENSVTERLKILFRQSVLSYEPAQNIIVIKTRPGLANAACVAIDHMEISSIVGTLAGDDTAFIVMRTNESALELCELIENHL